MSFTGIAFQISAVCPGCGSALPLNGAYTEFICAHCDARIETPPGFWRELLTDPFNESLNLKEKTFYVIKVSFMEYGLSVKLKYGRMRPRCTSPCRKNFETDELRHAQESDRHDLACSECGRPEDARLPPPWFEAISPAVSLLIAETPPPNAEVRRWYAVVDMGDAVGVVPRHALKLCDITPTLGGNLVLAWQEAPTEEAERTPRLALADGEGYLRWVQNRLDFSEHVYLHTSPRDGHIYLTDAEEGFILGFDPANGSLIKAMKSPPDRDPRALNVRATRRVFVDHDGSFLVFAHWDGLPGRSLKRFTREGHPTPVWPGLPVERGPKELIPFHWKAPTDSPERLPDSVLCGVGWDKHFYIVDRGGQKVAQYALDGELVDVIPCHNEMISRVRAFGVDENGVIHFLFKHEVSLQGNRWPHVARLHPDSEELELWLGPHAENGGDERIIGRHASRMKITPAGVVVLAGGMGSLRTIAPDGTVLWRSERTVQKDGDNLQIISGERG